MSTSIVKKDEPSSYVAIAFNHGINYLLLVGLIGFALVTGRWWVLLIAGLGEGLWLWSAPRIPAVRRSFDRRRRAEMKQLEEQRDQELLRTIGEEDRRRLLELERLGREIERLTGANRTLALELGAGGELGKLDRLIHSFVRIAAAAARYQAYVESTDLVALESDVKRQRTIVEKAEPEALSLARKNLVLLEKRLTKAAEIRRHVRTSRGQLNLIENTVRLLRDQIVTMESPEELHEQLDELLSSIDAIDSSNKETEALMLRLDSDAQTESSR